MDCKDSSQYFLKAVELPCRPIWNSNEESEYARKIYVFMERFWLTFNVSTVGSCDFIIFRMKLYAISKSDKLLLLDWIYEYFIADQILRSKLRSTYPGTGTT